MYSTFNIWTCDHNTEDINIIRRRVYQHQNLCYMSLISLKVRSLITDLGIMLSAQKYIDQCDHNALLQVKNSVISLTASE